MERPMSTIRLRLPQFTLAGALQAVTFLCLLLCLANLDRRRCLQIADVLWHGCVDMPEIFLPGRIGALSWAALVLSGWHASQRLEDHRALLWLAVGWALGGVQMCLYWREHFSYIAPPWYSLPREHMLWIWLHGVLYSVVWPAAFTLPILALGGLKGLGKPTHWLLFRCWCSIVATLLLFHVTTSIFIDHATHRYLRGRQEQSALHPSGEAFMPLPPSTGNVIICGPRW